MLDECLLIIWFGSHLWDRIFLIYIWKLKCVLVLDSKLKKIFGVIKNCRSSSVIRCYVKFVA